MQPHRSRYFHRKGSARPLRSRELKHPAGIRGPGSDHRKSLCSNLRNSAPWLLPCASGKGAPRRNHDELVRIHGTRESGLLISITNHQITNSLNPMKPTTESTTLTSATFEDLVQEMLVRLGEDPQREGLKQTPERVHKSMQFLPRGYTEDAEALLKGALFTVSYDEMVIVKDIEMFSLCEHHMLPFFGKVHVAYIP